MTFIQLKYGDDEIAFFEELTKKTVVIAINRAIRILIGCVVMLMTITATCGVRCQTGNDGSCGAAFLMVQPEAMRVMHRRTKVQQETQVSE